MDEFTRSYAKGSRTGANKESTCPLELQEKFLPLRAREGGCTYSGAFSAANHISALFFLSRYDITRRLIANNKEKPLSEEIFRSLCQQQSIVHKAGSLRQILGGVLFAGEIKPIRNQ